MRVQKAFDSIMIASRQLRPLPVRTVEPLCSMHVYVYQQYNETKAYMNSHYKSIQYMKNTQNKGKIYGDSKIHGMYLVQLNQYETAPYFNQFSQNLTCDCLLISVFCPKLL